jgi:hypothetical protein
MGRMKKSKPRRERPGISNTVLTSEEAAEHKHSIASVEVLDLPVIAAEHETGLVLEVAAVGVDGAGVTTGEGAPYVRCTDRRTFRLPESLRPWASTLVSVHLAHRQAGNRSMFPCRIEFGVLNGGAYAELL